MYHTHLHDQAQLSGGLYGPLIVVERGAKFDPEHDHVVVLSRGGPGPSEGPVLFNGGSKPPTLHWQTGQRYRLRFINIAAFDGIGVALLAPEKQLQWRAIARDGADLPSKQVLMQEARQSTLPGETCDFEYQPTEAGTLQLEVFNTRLKMKVVQQIEVRQKAVSLFDVTESQIVADDLATPSEGRLLACIQKENLNSEDKGTGVRSRTVGGQP